MRKMLKAIKDGVPGVEAALDRLTGEISRVNDKQATQVIRWLDSQANSECPCRTA